MVSLDVQFLPDVSIPCPDCRGSRYARAAYDIQLTNRAGQSVSLPELMDMDVNTALPFCADRKTVSQKLQVLQQLGLGYLTLGEETPSLSGGEAQRLKLASEAFFVACSFVTMCFVRHGDCKVEAKAGLAAFEDMDAD